MNVRPLHDRIIVHRLDEGEQRSGGIIIPDSAKEKPQQGTVLAAGYLLWLYQRAFFGNESRFVLDAEHHGHIPDILPAEYIAWTPMLIGIIVLGIFPNLLFKVIDPAVGVALGAVG